MRRREHSALAAETASIRRWIQTSRSGYAGPLAALALAILAGVSAYLISHTSTPPAARVTASSLASAPAYPTPALVGALPPETGPDGTAWQWVTKEASVALPAFRQNWLAFEALGSGARRTITFTGPAGEHHYAEISAHRDVYVVGPMASGTTTLRVTPALAPTPGQPPPVSALLSAIRDMPNPVAAIPGSGFWSTASEGGVVFNWMRNRGTLEIYTPVRSATSVSLSFLARSLVQNRTLTAQSAQTIQRRSVTTTADEFTLGPFRLVDGRARVLLQASPGARRYGIDPRALSVQLADLGATVSRTEP